MAKYWPYAFLLLLALSLVAGCAPRTPQPAPAPPPTPAPTQALAPRTAPQPEETAWAKIEAAAKREGKVTAYTFGMTGDVGTSVDRAFRQKFGIQVETVSGVGTVLIERIKSEHAAKKYVADTLDTSASILAQAREAGLIQTLADLPVLQQKGVWRVQPSTDPEVSFIGMSYQLMAPFINTTLVKPGEEPQSYLDLLEPRWKGRVTVASTDTTPNLVYIYAFRQKLGLNDDYFVRLGKQDLRQVANVRELYRSVVTGDAALILSGGSGSMSPFIKEGAPARVLDMKEGIIGILSPALSIVKDGPHPNAARLFANWLLSPEGQTAFNQARSSIPLRQEVPDFTPRGAGLSPGKVFVMDQAGEKEVARVMQSGELAKLVGLAKK